MGKHFDPGKFVTLFTDASFCPDTRAWGWAAWCKHGAPAVTIRRSGGGFGCPGSNHAESLALRHGIGVLLNEDIDLVGKIIVIQSDCQGALDGLDDMVLLVAGAKAVRKKHVKGHQGTKCARSSVNTWTDREAYREMVGRRQTIEETLT